MSNADWFRNALSNGPQVPAQQSQGYQQPQQPQYVPQAPQGYQQPPQQQYQDEEQARQSYGQQAWAAIKSGQAGMSAITGLFRGSAQRRQLEHENCPECGDPRFFTRSDPRLAKMNTNGQRCMPAPVCMACGYTTLFEQSGAGPLVADAPVQIDTYSIRHMPQKVADPSNRF